MSISYVYNHNRLGFSITQSSVTIASNMKTDHYHDFYELYYYIGDQMNYFIENESINVKKYDIVLIDKYTYHRTFYKDFKSGQRILITISEEIIRSIGNKVIEQNILSLFKKKKISTPCDINADILASINKMILLYNKSDSQNNVLRSQYLLLEFLMHLTELSHKGLLIEEALNFNNKETRIRDIVNYLNINYNKKILLEDLAKSFYVNKYYLCHIFKDITGLSVINYINKKRLAEAEKLLRYSDKNITEISNCVGYNSANRFSVLFKEKFGCTPKLFKKINTKI